MAPAVTPPEQTQPSALQSHRSVRKVLETELGRHLVQQTPLFCLEMHIGAALLTKAGRNSTTHRDPCPSSGVGFPWGTQLNHQLLVLPYGKADLLCCNPVREANPPRGRLQIRKSAPNPITDQQLDLQPQHPGKGSLSQEPALAARGVRGAEQGAQGRMGAL